MILGVASRGEAREEVKVYRRRWRPRAETRRPVLWQAAEMIVVETEGPRVRRGAGLKERSGQGPGGEAEGGHESEEAPRIEAGESGAMG